MGNMKSFGVRSVKSTIDSEMTTATVYRWLTLNWRLKTKSNIYMKNKF